MNTDRVPDIGDALEADPTSPQELPAVTGGGEMDIGTADMPANLEASSAVYWIMAFTDKHKEYLPEMQPWMTRLKQLAVTVEQQGPLAPGTPPPAPPPGASPLTPPPPAAGGAAAPPAGAPPGAGGIGAALAGALGAPPA